MASLREPPQQGAEPRAVTNAKALTKHLEDVSTVEVPATSDEEREAGARTGTVARYLVASPYIEQEHLLDLESVDAESGLLAEALSLMRNTRADYATAPYAESFNWDEVMAELEAVTQRRGHRWREASFFVVAFRSRIPPTTVYGDLGVLDKAAHAEATASGGFLKYWFGTPDSEGQNLATCVWRSLEDAKRGSLGPAHRKAAGSARDLYSYWKIDRLRLTIRDDLRSWDFADWVD